MMWSSGGGGPCSCLNSFTQRSMHYLYSLCPRGRKHDYCIFRCHSAHSAQKAVWYLKCTERGSQKTPNVLERGFKSTNLLGRVEVKRQRQRCLTTEAQGWWLALQPTACSRGRQDKKQKEEDMKHSRGGFLHKHLAGHHPVLWSGQAM